MEDVSKLTSLFVQEISRLNVLKNHPLVLMDVGCAGGIHPVWRELGDSLIAHGFDVVPDEIRLLQQLDNHPQIHYYAQALGLPKDHAFIQKRGERDYYSSSFVWDNLSAKDIMDDLEKESPTPKANLVDLSHPIPIDEWCSQNNTHHIDFLKIDTDGPDFEILISAEKSLHSSPILGIAMEMNFFGTDYETDHSFHNIDRYLKGKGYLLIAVSVRKYSSKYLPAPFCYNQPSKTTIGRALQGDGVYIIDFESKKNQGLVADLSTEQLLKMACICVIANVPDMAAQILCTYREKLVSLVDVEALLSLLVKETFNIDCSHKDYLHVFKSMCKESFLKKS